MSDQGSGGGYGSNWVKWTLIYLLIGGAIYAVVYFVFLAGGDGNGGGGGGYG